MLDADERGGEQTELQSERDVVDPAVRDQRERT